MKYTYLIISLLTIIISNTSYSGLIYCSDGDCRAQDSNSDITFTNGDTSNTVLWINQIIDSSLRVDVPYGGYPRNSKIFARNLDTSKTLSINSGSTINSVPGGQVDLYSDFFNTITLSSSGKSGDAGKNSSQICATNMASGILGTNASTYWSNRSSSLSQTDCTTEDVNWMNNQFSCPTGYTEQTTDSVNVSRIMKKNKCVASYYVNRCVKRTYDVSCNMNISKKVCNDQTYSINSFGDYFVQTPLNSSYSSSACNSNGVTLNNSGLISNYSFRVDEKTYTSYPSQELLCKYLIENMTKPTATYNYTHMVSGLQVTDKVNYATASYNDGSVKRLYNWPIPDNMVDSKGDTIAQADARFIVKSWVPTAYGSKLLYMDNYNNDSSIENESYNVIKNCMGLDGSSVTDFECEREPGPEMTLTAYLVDKYGAISDPIYITVPKGRYGAYWLTFPGNNGYFYYSGSYHVAVNGYTPAPSKTSKISMGYPECPDNFKSLSVSTPQLCIVKYAPWGWPGILYYQNTDAQGYKTGGQSILVSVKIRTYFIGQNWNSMDYWNYNHSYVSGSLYYSPPTEQKEKNWPLSSQYNGSGNEMTGYEFDYFAIGFETYTRGGWGPNGYDYY